jgi:hypothetical protein
VGEGERVDFFYLYHTGDVSLHHAGDVSLNFQMCVVEVSHLHARACTRSIIMLPSVQSQGRKEFMMISVHAACTKLSSYKHALRAARYKFAAQKFGNWKRIILFPISVSARVGVLYIFRHVEIGSGSSASWIQRFSAASVPANLCGRTVHTLHISPTCVARRS